MALEVKGNPSASPTNDVNKSSVGTEKRKGSPSGFAGFFGSVLSVARSSLVPELRSQNRDQQYQNASDYSSDDPVVYSDQSRQESLRVRETDSRNDVPRDDNGTSAGEDRTSRREELSYENHQHDNHADAGAEVAGRDSVSNRQSTNDSVEKSQEQPQGAFQESVDGAKAASETEAIGDSDRSRDIGSGQVANVPLSNPATAADPASGAQALSTTDILQFLVAFQEVLRTAVDVMNEGEFDAASITNSLASTVDGGVSEQGYAALLQVVQVLLTNGGENAFRQATSSQLSQNLAVLQAWLPSLEQGLQNLGSQLAKDIAQVLQLPLGTQSGLQSSSGNILLDASFSNGEIDQDLLERLQRVVAQLQTGTNAKGSVLEQKTSNEGVQKLNFQSSQILNELQGEGQLRNLREVLSASDDVRLRASRTFVEGDAKKTDNVIAKTAGNLLAQMASSAAISTDIRAQNRESMNRFTLSSKNFGDISQNAQTQGANGKGVDQGRAFSDSLLTAKILEGRGQADRFGENAFARQSGSSFSVSGAAGTFADKASQAVKSELPQNRQMFSQNLQEQVKVHIQRAVNNGDDRIRLQLRPAELGRLDIRIQVMKDSTYVLRIFVEKQESLDLLRNDSRALLDSLRESGIKTGDENLEFSLQEGTREQDTESKKKKGFGKSIELQELDEAAQSEVQGLTAENQSDNASQDDSSDEEERLDVVV